MQKYSIEGYYEYRGTQGKLTGELRVDEKTGKVEGDIVDYNSRVPHQKIMGEIKRNKEIALTFLKFPEDSQLANLLYSLKGNGNENNDISGNYEGVWQALPDAIGIAIHDTNFSAMGILSRIPEHTQSEYATLTLSKKTSSLTLDSLKQGVIYRHEHGLLYQISSVGIDGTNFPDEEVHDVTGYETGEKPKKFEPTAHTQDELQEYVLYTQLQAGTYPVGKKWVRKKQDFLDHFVEYESAIGITDEIV